VSPVKVLVACEFSGIVRDAFAALGHDAWSCDLIPSERPGNHVVGDARELLADPSWDLLIAHPPCTHLAVSGARWFKDKEREQEEALKFFLCFLNAPIPQIAVENPVCVAARRIARPTQIVHPYYFGDPEQKTTCLWLKGLPDLVPTDYAEARMMKLPYKERTRIFHMPPSPDRGRLRSKSYPGMAAAMAAQWGSAKDHCWRSRTGYRGACAHTIKPRKR
jgi:hypothetical protein